LHKKILENMGFSVLLALLVSFVFAQKPFPTFPSSYFVSFSLGLPQWSNFNITSEEQVRSWRTKDAERLEYSSSARDAVINVKTKALFGVYFDSTWSFVREQERSCRRDVLPSLSGLPSALPAHRDFWKYDGQVVLSGRTCDKWSRTVPENGANNTFAFFADESGNPVFYSYRGDSSSIAGFLHSPNYDAFDVSYLEWQPGPVDPAVFEAPCEPENMTTRTGGFDLNEFGRHFEADGSDHVFVPTTKLMSELPAEIDWVQKGMVVGIKDQGDCGSCYTFGSTAAVESAYAIKHNVQPVSLAEQVLMDCSWKHGNK
jgi:hypothetical protein